MEMKLAIERIERETSAWGDDIILTRPNGEEFLLCHEGCPCALRRLVGKSGTFTIVSQKERVGEGFLVWMKRYEDGRIDVINYTRTALPVDVDRSLPKNLAAALCRMLPEPEKDVTMRLIFKEKSRK